MARKAGSREDAIPAIAEVFREYGYEGASLALIGARAGLGKGSLYHAFPGGKAEMAQAVLDTIGGWFEDRIYAPLRDDPDPQAAIRSMLSETDAYFRSGRRVCLVGAFALTDGRDGFADRIGGYFRAWGEALAQALIRAGHPPAEAASLSEDAVLTIQGGLVLARALDDPAVFGRMLARLEKRLVSE